ncbi:hypothetical protein CORT_0E06080 [Candida orthopsilosis Co 90-125]|uniref:FIST domain-containing protein n=1 Tax=Candida orthopsilosis (strain 90-125) TaxID=1136231 RepID=H8X891_CANO9|nr:hypothetical protein CORT_0E06080 [Candida orthopsilosis Co 90-125]CCG24190.1 hypothetical protein CORT_0E06080 [Candida orthopsilosis Co 90-125]
MQRQFFRYLKTKSPQFHARSTINTLAFKLQPPTKFTPQSVLIFSTPTNLPQIIEDVIELHQRNNIQVVVAGIDTMVPFSARNGVSELWLDQRLKIGNSLLLEERDDLDKPPRESDGINPVSARKNWKNIQGHLSLKLRHEMDANINLANTVFSTGSILTLFYFDSETNVAHSGQHLCELEVALPRGVVPNHATGKIEDKWTPLYPGKSFKITNCVGNLLKSIEKNPAAKYLENNDKLMSLKSKDTEVFVKLRKKGTTVVDRFKVTAGGGGWGAKADIIALSPEAKPERGDEVEFFMVTPNNRFVKHKEDDVEKFDHTFAFISSYEETAYNGDDADTESEKIYETFGCGSELGFYFNGVKHHSPGETVYIKLK